MAMIKVSMRKQSYRYGEIQQLPNGNSVLFPRSPTKLYLNKIRSTLLYLKWLLVSL